MIHSVLMIGQSNMAGCGFLEEALPIDTEHIKVMRNGRWQRMFRPVNPDRPFAGVCLAESFAERYAQVYNVDVGLIPCAEGNTNLNQWQPGSLLFDNAVYQARLAQRTSTIVAVLWHQGEADCNPLFYPTYRERFEKMMAAFRKELDLYDVPFLVGELGEFLVNYKKSVNLPNFPRVNEALRDIAANNPMTGFVPSIGLTSNPDNVHFNSASLHEFGLRYFEVFQTLRDPNKVIAEKPEPDNALRDLSIPL